MATLDVLSSGDRAFCGDEAWILLDGLWVVVEHARLVPHAWEDAALELDVRLPPEAVREPRLKRRTVRVPLRSPGRPARPPDNPSNVAG